MKLSSLTIENFRGIEHLELDFTDELGRIRDLTLLVGPNGSGKSAILDAIWFGLQGVFGYPPKRPNFRFDPEYVVQQGASFAKISYQLFSDEIQRFIDANSINAEQLHSVLDTRTNFEFDVTYPAQQSYTTSIAFQASDGLSYYLGYRGESNNWRVIPSTSYITRLQLSTTGIDPKFIRELTSYQWDRIYLFGQERTIISNPVYTVPRIDYENAADFDIRAALVELGIRDRLGDIIEGQNWYQMIKDAFNYICKPYEMGRVVAPAPDTEYEIEFFDGDGKQYGFDGLSSGQRSVLNFLVKYFAKRMKNSIILIDELELYLHPDWQYRLLQTLMRLNQNDHNQFIIATHSPMLRQYVSAASTIELGKLQTLPAEAALIPDAELG